MLAQEATWLGGGLGQLCPLGGGDHQVSILQFRDPADAILVQMGQDHGVDVGRCVPEYPELGGERVLLANVETGKAIVDEPGEATGSTGVMSAATSTAASSCRTDVRGGSGRSPFG